MSYQSPFSWRYGSDEMRALWSEAEKRRRWRQVWVALAEAQSEAGLVSGEQVADLRAHMADIDLERAAQIEAEIHHDLMAEIKVYAEQCEIGGGIIHLGATSMDVSDNAEVTRQRDGLDLVLAHFSDLLAVCADQIERWADMACIGWTHLQPAEPTTIGYRLATYTQDLLADEASLRDVRGNLKGKGIKGAVGTAASYADLLEDSVLTPDELEAKVMDALKLPAFAVAHQTYPRRQDWVLISALAGLGGTLYRFAFDLRLLQSPAIGEWSEPFAEKQVGSSAMPFKRNPVNAENIDSLGRYLAGLPRVAWDNMAHSLLERTLDDSANRRSLIPEAFLAAEEMLLRCTRILRGLVVDERAVARNLQRYGMFAATERVLMALVRAGADRQAMHELIREHSMQAWQAVREGKENPLADRLLVDERILGYITRRDLEALLDVAQYVGSAPQRARMLVQAIRDSRGNDPH